ncbi:hypothetical protein K438DRAFT_2006966 [Mycena galopus ATCC 62051]|nr:hypothetical protein K438DRAFT_2006966 [Mycena galopus ATCC 62051]
MSSRTSNKNGLVAFPSVSQSLHSLPRATSMSNVALHPNMYAQRAKESEAKLQNAFTKPTLNPHSPPPVRAPAPPFLRVLTDPAAPANATARSTAHDARTSKIEMNAAAHRTPRRPLPPPTRFLFICQGLRRTLPPFHTRSSRDRSQVPPLRTTTSCFRRYRVPSSFGLHARTTPHPTPHSASASTL